MRIRRHPNRVRFGGTVIIIEALAAVAFLVYLLGHEALQIPLFSHDYTISAELRNADGLASGNHSPVLVSGVPEGHVVSVAYRNGLAVARLELPDSVRPLIHTDAEVQVVPRSALDDLMVDILPGTPGNPALRPGTIIPPPRTGSTVRFDEVIDVLDADTRAELQVMLSQLQIGLAGRAAPLRGALSELGALVDGTTTVTRQLAQRSRLLTGLVDSLDTMVTTLGNRQAALAGAVNAGQRTLAVTAARSSELAGTMEALPPALYQLSGALHAVDGLAVPLDPALQRLTPVARALPGALSALRAFDPAGVSLVGDLRSLVSRGSTPVVDLQRTLGALGPSSHQLEPTVRDLLPTLQAINVHKTGIGQLGDNFSGVFSTNDVNGPILRGLGFFEQFNPADLGFSGTSASSLAHARADTVAALVKTCLHVNPIACVVRYLVPGLSGSVVPLSQAPQIVGGGG
jgi:phospholipid/cholesterol/gamma-HCH transport system substrate-binding protein